MTKSKINLSELDIKYIISKLGRIPTDIEQSFIELILSYEIENRSYFRILSRLNDGAKRKVNNKIGLNDKFNLLTHTGFKIIDRNYWLMCDKDDTGYINKINNLDSVLDDMVINSFSIDNVEKIIKKEVTNRKNSQAIGGRFYNDEKNGLIFFTTIGIEDRGETNRNSKLNNSLVYKINFGKRSIQKNINQLSKFIKDINNEAWFLFAKSIDWNGLGVALINLMKDKSHGISITKDLTVATLISHFSDDNTLSILIVVHPDSHPQLNKFCKKRNLNLNKVGTLTTENIMQVRNKNDTLVNLSIVVFDLQYNVNTKHFIQPEIDIKSSKPISNIVSKTSFTNQLLKLFTNITTDDILLYNSAHTRKLIRNYSSYGLYSANDSIDEQIVLTQADKNQLIDVSPRLSGRASVANAVRRLACTGAKPKAVIIQNILPKMNEKSLWKASELLQGQEEAIRELEIEIGNRTIDTFEDYWHQNISAIGIHQQHSAKMDISFKNDGNFISLLGSHRGELTGSAYEQYITNEKSDVLPTVDLQMEKRLQDVVHLGITTNLIKSAVNVNTGGISIAIAKSLIASDEGLGARIHLSRKLKDEELLFGETQGLVIVTLLEEDIMEFERICMTIGVPSTTIGRVTDNDLFTFNETLKIKVDKMRAVL